MSRPAIHTDPGGEPEGESAGCCTEGEAPGRDLTPVPIASCRHALPHTSVYAREQTLYAKRIHAANRARKHQGFRAYAIRIQTLPVNQKSPQGGLRAAKRTPARARAPLHFNAYGVRKLRLWRRKFAIRTRVRDSLNAQLQQRLAARAATERGPSELRM